SGSAQNRGLARVIAAPPNVRASLVHSGAERNAAAVSSGSPTADHMGFRIHEALIDAARPQIQAWGVKNPFTFTSTSGSATTASDNSSIRRLRCCNVLNHVQLA